MKTLIVLGNRLNDDGTLSIKALKRCEIAVHANELFHPDRIIITGGVANENTVVSEARAMYTHLTENLKMDKELFILEEKSTSSTENAVFSFDICVKEGIDEAVIISSIEHFGRLCPKNAILCFRDVIKDYPTIKMSMYTEEY